MGSQARRDEGHLFCLTAHAPAPPEVPGEQLPAWGQQGPPHTHAPRGSGSHDPGGSSLSSCWQGNLFPGQRASQSEGTLPPAKSPSPQRPLATAQGSVLSSRLHWQVWYHHGGLSPSDAGPREPQQGSCPRQRKRLPTSSRISLPAPLHTAGSFPFPELERRTRFQG